MRGRVPPLSKENLSLNPLATQASMPTSLNYAGCIITPASSFLISFRAHLSSWLTHPGCVDHLPFIFLEVRVPQHCLRSVKLLALACSCSCLLEMIESRVWPALCALKNEHASHLKASLVAKLTRPATRASEYLGTVGSTPVQVLRFLPGVVCSLAGIVDLVGGLQRGTINTKICWFPSFWTLHFNALLKCSQYI